MYILDNSNCVDTVVRDFCPSSSDSVDQGFERVFHYSMIVYGHS